MSLSIGFDPEVSIFKAKKFLPAWDFTKGTKNSPEIIDESGVGILWDGVALEINAPPILNVVNPAQVVGVWENTWGIACTWARKTGIAWSVAPAVSAYSSDITSHVNARVFGCSEDFSAYAENPHIARTLAFDPTDTTKCFGGHIHIGYDINLCPPHIFVRLMDLFWGMVAQERQQERRHRFGLPGLFRYKPYGVEYRTPSNAWVIHTPVLRHLVGSAILINDLLVESQKDLINLYRMVDWESVNRTITTERFGGVNKFMEPIFSAISKFNLHAHNNYFAGSGIPLKFIYGDGREEVGVEMQVPEVPPDDDDVERL